MPSPIRHVSDTARWVAIYRARESARPDRLFDDPFAGRMAGARGDAIVDALPHGESMAWAVVVRTAVMDELILRCVADGATTVLNLGAGLDTRAFRLDLPARLNWIDVDLPEMVEYRRGCLDGATVTCRHQHWTADVTDPEARAAVLADATRGAARVLVISEGLLVYLEPEQVEAIGRQLHAASGVQWWLADLITPLLVNTFGTLWSSHLDAAHAPFRFAPNEPAAFFEPLGWREAESRSTWDESLRLGRAVPAAWWWNMFGRAWMPSVDASLRQMASIVLFERVPKVPAGRLSCPNESRVAQVPPRRRPRRPKAA